MKKISFRTGFPIPRGYAGICLFPFGIYINPPLGNIKKHERLVNHERIHWEQQKELLCIFFYILYGIFYLINLVRMWNHKMAYKCIPFEMEAYNYAEELDYLNRRKRFSWWSWI